MTRHIAILSFLAVALSAHVVYAQDGDREEARAHFQKGQALYNEGNFREALAEFQQGQDVLADPSFDYSIALCWWKLGDIEAAEKRAAAAVAGFMEYERAEPTALNQGHLIAFQRLAKVAEVAESMPDEPEVVATVEEPPRERSGTPIQTWIGAGTAIAGVGLLAWWGVTELSLGATIDDYEAAAAAGDAQSWQALRSDIDSKQTQAKVLLFSGAGLTAVGGALLIWGLSSSGKDEKSTTTVYATPTGAGFVWTF